MTLPILRTCLPLLTAVLAIGVGADRAGAGDDPSARGPAQQAHATAGGEDKAGKEPAGERARHIASETRKLEAAGSSDDDWQEVETKRVPIKR